IPRIEQLEARETPDVSLSHAPACAVVPRPAQALVSQELLDRPAFPSLSARLEAPATIPGAVIGQAFENSTYLQILETIFINAENVQQLLDRTEKALPTASTPGTSGEPQTREPDVETNGATEPCLEPSIQGCQFLCNYARKAIRNERLQACLSADREDI